MGLPILQYIFCLHGWYEIEFGPHFQVHVVIFVFLICIRCSLEYLCWWSCSYSSLESSLPSCLKTRQVIFIDKIYTVSQKKRANFETVYLKIITIDLDDIWQKYSKDSRIDFVCFSFCVGLPFLWTFRLSNRTLKITQILKISPHSACQHGPVQ